ncbi:chalcone isomerase family protein [Pontibacter sp. G13]|uniref:chalcone isomerase family protein n=1 Tax=Pontibacter sp. G13 TaxID=3074898 RepID=UPI00288BDF3D|nr:chalcone isomerase family protein [Pontibacter sp. G13]WNJ21596.1 chalcone isomerase family protein [Pontibacter sp. G13]
MRILVLIGLMAMLMLPAQAQTRKVSSVELNETESFDGNSLQLNGAGVRSKYFMDLYVGALYLTEKSSSSGEIIKSTQPQAIRLHIISSLITSEKMISSTEEGFENATGDNTAPISAEIKQFIDAFSAPIEKGDIFDMVNTADGVKVYKNAKLLTTVKGAAFKEALFGIWLGADPAQSSLKRGMLGLK